MREFEYRHKGNTNHSKVGTSPIGYYESSVKLHKVKIN
jgi:hypothetical protein